MSDISDARVAYFCMGFGVEPKMLIYSGGLEILAGDYLKSCADLGKPVVGIGMLYHRGHSIQHIVDGRQVESYPDYDPRTHMTELPQRVKVSIEGRVVTVKAWRYDVVGQSGFVVPLLLLDTHCPETPLCDKDITDKLYGGDDKCRISQEAILGIGGVRMLQELGCDPEVYHLNEGHGAFVPLELRSQIGTEKAKEKCVFTTHTPVAAGHDSFDYGLARSILGDFLPTDITELAGRDRLNMTTLAVTMSRYFNAVSRLHAAVTSEMFGISGVDYIANGVHLPTWTTPPMQALYDRYLKGWRQDPSVFLFPERIPPAELAKAHTEAKALLIEYANIHSVTGAHFDPKLLTIGFGRRFATYKRATLAFTDPQEFQKAMKGKAQFLFAGKAHPMDQGGKQMLADVIAQAKQLVGIVSVGFLPNYDMDIGRLMTGGSDIWLNNPERPREASGTSGMKSNANGRRTVSILDGWLEMVHSMGGVLQGGWPIGTAQSGRDWQQDARELIRVLRDEVIPSMQDPSARYSGAMQALRNAAYFNSDRMVKEYFNRAYFPNG